MPNSHPNSPPNPNHNGFSLRNCALLYLLVVCGSGALWLALVPRGFEIPASNGVNFSIVAGQSAGVEATNFQGPANGRCEIVAPNGAVVASFVSVAGGHDNGWGARVQYTGWNNRPRFIIDAPKNAPAGYNYRISTAALWWPQSSALFNVISNDASVVSSAPLTVPPSVPAVPPASPHAGGRVVTAVRQGDLTIRNAGNTVQSKEILGKDLYGDVAEDQTAEQVAVSGEKSIYRVDIHNQSDVSAMFKLEAEVTQSSPNSAAIHFFDAASGGNDITDAIYSFSGWSTPLLPANQRFVVRVEIDGNFANVAATTLLHLKNQSGVFLDSVRATASRQSIARVEVSVNQGKTWKVATQNGVTVPESTVVGFRVVKKDKNLPWPNDPLKPEWHTQETTYMGESTWLQGDAGAENFVTAQCGNAITTKFRVTRDNPTSASVQFLQNQKP